MSEDRIQNFDGKLGVLDRIVTVGWTLAVQAFLIGVWAATLEWRIRDHDTRIHRQEGMTENLRITAATATTEALNGHDKRLQRLEDSILSQRATLDRIETKLSTR